MTWDYLIVGAGFAGAVLAEDDGVAETRGPAVGSAVEMNDVDGDGRDEVPPIIRHGRQPDGESDDAEDASEPHDLNDSR